MISSTLTQAWLWQAKACEALSAPFTGALLRSMATTPTAAAALAPLVEPVAGRSAPELLTAATPIRVLGGLHYAVLSGLAPDLARLYETGAIGDLPELGARVAAVLSEQRSLMTRFMASPPQTNEVRRSLCLIGGFLEVAETFGLPLRCLELGASAGLNMNWDRFAYAFGGEHRWGPPDAPLTISGAWSGGLPPLDASPFIAEKRACDISPIDASSQDGALRLQAYIWPEQTDRLTRIRQAIALARETGVQVEAANAADWVGAVADPVEGAATVIYHSIFMQYPPPDARAAIIAAIQAAGARATPTAPLAWLRMEPITEVSIDIEVRLTLWPGGHETQLAEVHPHGAVVRWRESG